MSFLYINNYRDLCRMSTPTIGSSALGPRALAETLRNRLLGLRLLQTILPAPQSGNIGPRTMWLIIRRAVQRVVGGGSDACVCVSIGRAVPRNRSHAGDEEYERTALQEEEARPPVDLGLTGSRAERADSASFHRR